MFGAFLFGKGFFMILSNGTEVITKPDREKDTEEIATHDEWNKRAG